MSDERQKPPLRLIPGSLGEFDAGKLLALAEKLEAERIAREQRQIESGEAIEIHVYIIDNYWRGPGNVEEAKAVALARHGELAPGQTPIYRIITIDTCPGLSDEPRHEPVPYTVPADLLRADVIPEIKEPPPMPKPTRARDLSDAIYGGHFDEPGEGDSAFSRRRLDYPDPGWT